MAITTDDINGWRRVVRAIAPLLLPSATAFVAWLLQRDSWQVALAGAITGTVSALWTWALPGPSVSIGGSSKPPPIPPPQDGPPTTDLPPRPPTGPITFMLIAFASLMTVLHSSRALGDPAAVATRSSSSAHATAPDEDKIVLGPSMTAQIAAIRLDGPTRALSLGVGFGAHLDAMLLGLPIRLALYGAPELQIGDGSYVSAALLAYVGTARLLAVPVGGGIGWDAFAIGGPDPGLHDLHRRHLFLYGSFGIPLFEGGP